MRKFCLILLPLLCFTFVSGLVFASGLDSNPKIALILFDSGHAVTVVHVSANGDEPIFAKYWPSFADLSAANQNQTKLQPTLKHYLNVTPTQTHLTMYAHFVNKKILVIS